MIKKRKRIYLDYAATTPCDPQVVKAMLPYFTKNFGNTSSIHQFGQDARKALEKSRRFIAEELNAKRQEIIFTGSATESNNTVLKGIAWANKAKGKEIIISAIEHDCIINSAKWLEKQGYLIKRLPVDKQGRVSPKSVKSTINNKTILVSIMHANNEIGTIQPIKEIGQICHEKKVLFHTDAAQTFGKYKIDVKKLNIDLLTASSVKIYGPKGAALLYIKKGVKMEPLLHGGGQEFGLRSSTVNVASIVGFAKAVEIYQKLRKKEQQRIIKLKDNLIKGIISKISHVVVNGDKKNQLYNIASISFLGVEGEAIAMHLDIKGIAVSTGSACSSESLLPSHVLQALKLKPEEIHGSIRFSIGRFTTAGEIDYVLQVLPEIIKKLRKISPF